MPNSFLLFIIVCLFGYIIKMKWEFSRKLRQLNAASQSVAKPVSGTVPYIKSRATVTRAKPIANSETADTTDDQLGTPRSEAVISVKQKIEPVVSKDHLATSSDDSQSEEKLTQQTEEKFTQQTVDTNKQDAENTANPANRDYFISLYLQAPDNTSFAGYELLQAILSAGFRYGEHSIFHYFESKSVMCDSLFSLSSAISPGTFDLPNMGSYTTKALSFILNASVHDDPLAVFDKMLHVAGQLRESLGGELLTSDCRPLTKEQVRDLCMDINHYVKQKNNLDMFEQMEATV